MNNVSGKPQTSVSVAAPGKGRIDAQRHNETRKVGLEVQHLERGWIRPSSEEIY